MVFPGKALSPEGKQGAADVGIEGKKQLFGKKSLTPTADPFSCLQRSSSSWSPLAGLLPSWHFHLKFSLLINPSFPGLAYWWISPPSSSKYLLDISTALSAQIYPNDNCSCPFTDASPTHWVPPAICFLYWAQRTGWRQRPPRYRCSSAGCPPGRQQLRHRWSDRTRIKYVIILREYKPFKCPHFATR